MELRKPVDSNRNHHINDRRPQVPVVETLEGRVFMSASPPAGTWDAGDYYWGGGQRFPLLRATDEMVVGFESRRGAPAVVRRLTAPDGPLHGFKLSQWLGKTIADFVIKKPLGIAKFRVRRRKTDAATGVGWASPGFVSMQPGGPFRMAMVDTLFVVLDPALDPAQVFAHGFTGYSGQDSHFTVHVAKGGVMAIRQANWLRENVPGVIEAEADDWSTFKLL